MKICPITYQSITNTKKYALAGLKKLAPGLVHLKQFDYSAAEQREKAAELADKLSIEGVQPKLSARLSITEQEFKIVDHNGHYILKPQHHTFAHLPENEDVSMRLAATAGIETPLHGLLYCKDDSLTYFIKRFDRIKHKDKLAVEDFAQLMMKSRDVKYQSSMEHIIPVIDKYCSFPVIEKTKLFTRVIVNFLIGNEDMHLKNYSLITRKQKIELAPAYDFVNSTIVIKGSKEEIALPIKGKKRNLNRKLLVNYYGHDKLDLPTNIIEKELAKIESCRDHWRQLIDVCFLPTKLKKAYRELLDERWDRIYK